MIAVLAVFSRASIIHSVSAQSSSIDLSKEYASGDVDVFPYLQAWYTWININGTHTIFLALHSYQAQSPVSAFVGQGYNTTSGSKVFVANALLAMEVYNDTNANGYLDANYGAGTTELKYLLVMNASQTFTVNPVQKTQDSFGRFTIQTGRRCLANGTHSIRIADFNDDGRANAGTVGTGNSPGVREMQLAGTRNQFHLGIQTVFDRFANSIEFNPPPPVE